MSSRSFLDNVLYIVANGKPDKALYLLYDSVDEMIQDCNIIDLNSILEHAKVDLLTDDIILGLLTATLPVKSKLPYRTQFFKLSEESLKRRGLFESGLLTGLE